MQTSHSRAFGLFVCTILIASLVSALSEDECSVCFTIVNKLIKFVRDEKLASELVTEKFLEMCKTANGAEQRFCYFLGGQDVSATRTYKDMIERIGWGMPANKVCEHLKSRDPQVCELKQKKPIDLKTVDLKKLKVVDLKRILKDRDAVCEGCFEKAEFYKKVEELKKLDEEKESRDEL